MGVSGPARRGSVPRRKRASASGPRSRKRIGQGSSGASGASGAPVCQRKRARSSPAYAASPKEAGDSSMARSPLPAARPRGVVLFLELLQVGHALLGRHLGTIDLGEEAAVVEPFERGARRLRRLALDERA